jgi:hypothetical protein
MTASSGYSIIVSTKIEKDQRGVFVATSPELRGLLVVSKDRNALEEVLIPQAITDLYLACGVRMVVTRIAREERPADQWVATPLDAIRAAESSASAA